MKSQPSTNRVDAALAGTREEHAPRSFAERLTILTGETTYREPVEGRATQVKPIPAAHQIAAALAFGREGPSDIGPDIAYDMATGTTGHAVRVCRTVAEAMAAQRGSRPVRRCRPWLRVITWAAYCSLVDKRQYPLKPGEVAQADWDLLVPAAALIMERLAEDTLALCERRWRRAG